MSFFSELSLLPPDPILSLAKEFVENPNEKKVQLGIGSYRTKEGFPFVFSAVKKAISSLYNRPFSIEYTFVEGIPSFREKMLDFLFPKKDKDFLFCLQTVGSSSALRLLGNFLFLNHNKQIFISDPSWTNHQKIFSYAGLSVEKYPYYDYKKNTLSFDLFLKTLQTIPEKSSILFQVSSHNPTGLDFLDEEWKKILFLIKKKNLLPIFDLAYHGLGKDFTHDFFPVSLFLNQNTPFFLCYSFSKNMGLYGERVGALLGFFEEKKVIDPIVSHLKDQIRSIYSTPPLHGALIVSEILGNPLLLNEWQKEVSVLQKEIENTRKLFVKALLEKGATENSVSYLLEGKGMFSLLPLSKEDVFHLKKQKGIYLTENGRINFSGISSKDFPYVLESLAHIFL